MVAPNEEPIIRKTILEVLGEADDRQERRFARMEEQFKVEFGEVKREIQKVNDTLRLQEIRQTKFETKQDSEKRRLDKLENEEIKEIKDTLKDHEKCIKKNENITAITKWVGITIGAVFLVAIAYGLLSLIGG